MNPGEAGAPRRRDRLAIAAVLTLLAAALAWGGFAWRLERLLYDTGLGLAPTVVPADIVIVAIDDASIAAIGRWPWPRTVHATLLEQLAQAQPRAVAFDLILSEPDPNPAHDALLASALRSAAPVVLPVSWRSSGAGLVAIEPVPLLRDAAAALGQAQAPVDDDGVLRHMFLRAGPAGAPYRHLALALLEVAGAAQAASLRPEFDPGSAAGAAAAGWVRDGRLAIRYLGPPGTIDRVSYLDLLRAAVPAQRLRGRYVLVGLTAQGLGDTLATPVNARHHAMPGVEVLANELHMLASGRGIAACGPLTTWLLASLLLVSLLALLARAGERVSLMAALGSLPLAVLASLLALRGGVWCSPVPYLVPALLAYPLWSWRRLEHVVALLDREIAGLGAGLPVPAGDPAPRTPDDLAARMATLHRAGALVQEARAFLAGALEGLPAATLVGDDAGRVMLANSRAAALFDVDDAAELCGLDLARLLAESTSSTPPDWPAVLAALRPGEPGVAAEVGLAGGDHVIHAAAVELAGQGRIVVAIADIAPVKQAQRQREEALAFVSHDLRSPASSIVMLADLDAQGRLPLTQPQLLSEVRRLAGRVLALADDFVRAARAETWPLDRVPVQLSALLDEAGADLEPQARAAGVTLAFSAAAGRTVVVDHAMVQRALANLIGNAIKHAPAGTQVAVAAVRTDSRIVFRVRDQGAGLAPDQLAQLAGGSEGVRVGHAHGVGLGLVFVQRVARRHGGTLRAAAAPGGGACFELEIDAGSGNP